MGIQDLLTEEYTHPLNLNSSPRCRLHQVRQWVDKLGACCKIT